MENIRTIFIYVMVVLCAICTGCVTTATDGIESLVESRIILERDRIRGEYAAELAGWVNQDLREIGERLDNITDGQALLRAAIEEYRRFTLELIERLQRAENQGIETDQMVIGWSDFWNMVSTKQYSDYDIPG